MQTAQERDDIRGSGYQVHIGLGLRRGLSSRTRPAETILFSFRTRSSSSSCVRVFPSLSTTFIFEYWCSLMPIRPRPLMSIRLSVCPFVTQASANKVRVRTPLCSQTLDAEQGTSGFPKREYYAQTIIFFSSMPFSVACDFAMTSMFLIRLLARFSLNVICKMAASTGLPEI